MTIYVIEDHPTMRKALEMVYRRIQSVQEVSSMERFGLLEAAIEKHGAPTFFSLDLKLPDTTGVSGIRMIRLLYPLVPLAIISASPSTDWEDHCYEAGADIYIEKSSHITEIYAGIRSLLFADDSFEEPISIQKLSKRQLQLMQSWSNKMSNKRDKRRVKY